MKVLGSVAMVLAASTAAPGAFVGVNWAGNVVLVGEDGSSLPVGPTGYTHLNSMARDSQGTLIAVNDAISGSARLLEINPATGEATNVGTPFLNHIRALAYSPDDTLYALDGQLGSKRLYTLQDNTNTFIGELPFGAAGGMTFAPDGTLYGWDVNNGLLIIDPETADATNVSGQQDGISIATIAFGPDGALYGAHDELYVIDLDTGQPTQVGTMNVDDIRGMEWVDDVGLCLGNVTSEVLCHAGGATFTVNIEGFNPCTGGTSMFTFTGSGGAVGAEMCFTLLVDDGGLCCSVEVCVTIPDCVTDACGDCNVPGNGPGCSDPECEAIVCAVDPFCCNTQWDGLCVGEADELCEGCAPPELPSDVNGDGIVGMVDFLALLAAWGSCSDCGTPQACPADLDGDCSVGILDLLIMLGNWS